MASYKTPGVYVEEIPTLPQSVADVPTAIPGFVGYTEYATAKSDRSLRDLENIPQRISSLIEYERYFGKGPKLELDTDGNFKKQFVTYDSLRLFFDNGGGVCYVVSIGSYNNEVNSKKFIDGLATLKNIDEVTLLVMPDAATCLDAVGLGSVQQQALKQCRENKDRFAILDVKEDKSQDRPEQCFKNFRDNIGMVGLQYGATYYPYIATTYNHKFGFKEIIKHIIREKHKGDFDAFIADLKTNHNFNAQAIITIYRTWIDAVEKNDEKANVEKALIEFIKKP